MTKEDDDEAFHRLLLEGDLDNTVAGPDSENRRPNYGEDDESDRFRIAPKDREGAGVYGDATRGARLELEATDFRDRAAEAQRKRKLRKVGFAVAALAFGALVLFSAGLATPSSNLNENLTVEGLTPVALLADSWAEPHRAEIGASASGETLTTRVGEGVGAELKFTGATVEASSNCRLIQAGEFDACATVAPALSDQAATIWIFKNAPQSGVLRNITLDFSPAVSGAKASAVFEVVGFSDAPKKALLIVAPDSVGYMVLLPENSTANEIESYASTIVLTP